MCGEVVWWFVVRRLGIEMILTVQQSTVPFTFPMSYLPSPLLPAGSALQTSPLSVSLIIQPRRFGHVQLPPHPGDFIAPEELSLVCSATTSCLVGSKVSRPNPSSSSGVGRGRKGDERVKRREVEACDSSFSSSKRRNMQRGKGTGEVRKEMRR